MGLENYSSLEVTGEQNEAPETPLATTTPEATPVAEAVATEPVTTETGDQPCDCKNVACDCNETPKTE